jgi:2,3-bisphosphoglycerate-independent phosphoglycerate mutase
MKNEKLTTLIIVGDGMSDEPVPALDGKTPLQSAHTPNMDFLARNGTVGLLRSVPEGMSPGSDIANMSLMGYDPSAYYTGRAPLEAASMGIRMSADDLAFRCNLVSLEPEGQGDVMRDYSGGGVSTERADVCIQALNRALSGPDVRFHTGVSYRHLMLWKQGAERFSGLVTTPPHDISGRPVEPHLPRGSGSGDLTRIMEQARELLSPLEEGPNAIWFWGEGIAPRMPTLTERFGIRGATVCAVDLIKGLGIYAGMDAVHVPGATGDIDTNFQGKAVAALKAAEKYDLVFLHVEAPDEASHRGILKEKVRAIERFDDEVIGLLRKGFARKGLPHRMVVLPDHATPLRTCTHAEQPVPFLLYSNPIELPLPSPFQPPASRAAAFDENEAMKSGILLKHGHKLLEYLFNQGS